MLNRLLLYSPELLHASQLPLLLHLHVVHGMHYLICKFVLVGGQAGGKEGGTRKTGEGVKVGYQGTNLQALTSKMRETQFWGSSTA